MSESSSPSSSSSPKSSIRGSLALASEQLRGYNMSVFVLSGCALVFFYVLGSLFPYSGFMAMHLIDGLTEENNGKYAGPLISAFMIGRALGAVPWGKIADVYGRRFVLVASLFFSAVFSILFGLSTTYTMAIVTRFCLGCGNGIMIVARTSITELAKGDHAKESKGMGHIMSMGGYGMLFAPALGGILSDPVKQYPDNPWLSSSGNQLHSFFEKYPFFLPNFVGALLSLLAMLLVMLCVEETLPEEKRRSSKYILTDFFHQLCRCCPCFFRRQNYGYETIGEAAATTKTPASVSTAETTADTNNNELQENEEEELQVVRDSINSDAADSAALATKDSRESFLQALKKPSAKSLKTDSNTNDDPESSKPTEDDDDDDDEEQPILSKKSTRSFLMSYWINTFYITAFNDSFPLFAMSGIGGLNIDEKEIGGIAAISGLIFSLTFHFLFTWSMNHFGLMRLTRLSALLQSLSVLLPVSLLMKQYWIIQYAFLSILNATVLMLHSMFCSCITIGTNRTVPASKRATVNGLSSVGASVGRGLGPMFAGVVVAFSFSEMLVPIQYGGILIYCVFEVFGIISYLSTLFIIEE